MQRFAVMRQSLVMVLVICLIGCGMPRPPLSPQQALATFQLPAGFHIELAASEPDVVSPVAMSFDERGRLFVVEMLDYPLKPEALGRIKLLEDLDGDGRFEKSTIFADRLHFPNGVMAWRGGILVTCAPDILYLADTDGDNRADVRRVVLTGFAETNPQLRVNGPVYGLDNWIYVAYPGVSMPTVYVKEFGDPGKPISFPDHPEVPAVEIHQTDVRFQPEKARVEAASGNSEFGNTFDSWGNRFTVWNNDHVRHIVLQNKYLSKNPYLEPTSSIHSASDHEKASKVYPITQELNYIHESEVGHFTSACGISVCTGGSFPPEYEGNCFVCEPAHNLVHRDALVPSGATFIAKRTQDGVEFLGSTDGWFRPVFTTVGPDGALYVVDYYHKVIEHPEWIPPEKMNEADLYAGSQRGRIYRVVFGASRPSPRPKLSEASIAGLVQQLSNPNMWWRTTAQRLLVERKDQSAVPLLQDLARQNSVPLGRVHALWTLEELGGLQTELLWQALGDSNPRVREQAIRLAENHLEDSKLKNRLLQMLEDPDARVQFQLACTLGQLSGELSFRALQQIAFRHLDDKWFRLGVLTAVAQNAARWFRSVTSLGGFVGKSSKGVEEFLAQLASVQGARQKDPEIAEVLTLVAKSRNEQDGSWQTASLEGLADGLKRGPERRAKLARTQHLLIQLLGTRSSEMGDAALGVMTQLNVTDSPELRRVIGRASRVAASQEAKLQDRTRAIGILGLDPTASSLLLLEKFLSPQQPQELQVATVGALTNFRDAKVTGILLDKWRTYTGPVREAVLTAFFNDRSRLLALLNAIKAEKVQPWSLTRAMRSQLRHSLDAEIRERAKTLIQDATDNDRKVIFEKYRPSLRLSGSAERGKEVFREICSKCHKIGNMGYEVGPDLLSVTNRPKEQFLMDILIPNLNIEEGYEEYLAQTTDGRLITGIIAKQGPTAVTLRRAKGEEDTVLRSNLTNLRSLSLSAMPEDLEKNISIEGMADLLAFLKRPR